MNTKQAKIIIENFLLENNLSYIKLTAKTISFSDLARCDTIFVKIHGWNPDPKWSDLQKIAKQNGFCIE